MLLKRRAGVVRAVRGVAFSTLYRVDAIEAPV